MITSEQANKIKQIEKELQDLNNKHKMLEVKAKGQSYHKFIDSIGGVQLFTDCIMGQGRKISIESDFNIEVITGGQISYSSKTTGGGARPTLTRIAAGGMVAGPIGAIVGGAAQKHKKIKTTEIRHDDRTLRLVIIGSEGAIDLPLLPMQENHAREFMAKAINARVDFEEYKKSIDKQNRANKKAFKEFNESGELVKKRMELKKYLSNFKKKDIEAYHSCNKKVRVLLVLGIIVLLTSIFPVLPLVAAIIILIILAKMKGSEEFNNVIKATKILCYIAIAINLIASIILLTYNPNRKYTIEGEEITLVCDGDACTKLDSYGGSELTKKLVELGVRKISNTEKDTKQLAIFVTTYDNAESGDPIKLRVKYLDSSFKRLAYIENSDATEIKYYISSDAKRGDTEIYEYPSIDIVKKAIESRDEINRQKEEAEAKRKKEEEEKQKKEEEARQAAERAKAAEDDKYPSESGTRSLCDQAFHRMYPYKGSKVHSILGVHALGRSGKNLMIYKVDVTVENAYGAKYDAVMECVVSRDANSDIIRVKSLNLI